MIVKVVFTPFIYQPSVEAECVKRAKKKTLMGFWWRTLFANLAADSSRFFSSWWKSSLLQPLLPCTKFSFSENPSSNPGWFNMITKINDRVFIENGLDQKYVIKPRFTPKSTKQTWRQSLALFWSTTIQWTTALRWVWVCFKTLPLKTQNSTQPMLFWQHKSNRHKHKTQKILFL